ncbi:uncharacterized protein OCT59_027106 [Rhizophagus irregularis]|uniref:uncharacterized protein n=1 Tax=Rhizophagus irregularis TaxID=588596 RepID=UPI000CB1DF79|nr:hypothetical protein RhiirB3_426132 [Rhizophagus irregularis]UZO06797.1 hypothetical protein OCT59_027106 [Rhizophagus irregularis]GBC45456.1 hypothetical protein GLOIN_2v1573959 [Rhizophagus irregularis DAOM 181602=DAOM 197198]
MSQLTGDCINEIVEYLNEDKVNLRSCLLINRLWCKISVRIYWREIRNLSALIAFFPDESKEILCKNGITILTSNPPAFNYASFCKFLSVYEINCKVEKFLTKRHITHQHLKDSKVIMMKEIYKFLMGQITSLRKVEIMTSFNTTLFTSYHGAKDCLKYLSELTCYSNISPKLFYHLSQICYNLQTLRIKFNEFISNGLEELISVQRNLKHLFIMQSDICVKFASIFALIANVPNNLITLNIYKGRWIYNMSLSFIARFTNLQILTLTSFNKHYEDFNKLQYAIFPQLQVLEFKQECPRNELLIKFLENNGKNLKELYVKGNDNSLNLAIIKFCPNLIKLSTKVKRDCAETIKLILSNCRYLEGIKIFYEKKIDMIGAYNANVTGLPKITFCRLNRHRYSYYYYH